MADDELSQKYEEAIVLYERHFSDLHNVYSLPSVKLKDINQSQKTGIIHVQNDALLDAIIHSEGAIREDFENLEKLAEHPRVKRNKEESEFLADRTKYLLNELFTLGGMIRHLKKQNAIDEKWYREVVTNALSCYSAIETTIREIYGHQIDDMINSE